MAGEHEGGGPGIDMPAPTVWPMVLATGVVLLATGVVTNLVISAIGATLLLVALGGWIGQLLPGKGHFHEPREPHKPQPIAARPGTVEPLKPGTAGYRFRMPEKMHPISAGIKGGIVGGLVMPIPALLYGILSQNGIWYPVNLLAGVVLPGMDHQTLEQLQQFQTVPFVVGLLIHAAVSLTVGLVYGVLLPTLPGNPLLTGGLIMPVLWTWGIYAFMGVINPALAERVNWPSFIVAQFVFGVAAALVVTWSQKVYIPPAGGPPGAPPPGPRPGEVRP